MDYAKTFDTVPHRRLVYKLSKYGINNKTVSWIKNFPSNRIQQVVVQGEESTWNAVLQEYHKDQYLDPYYLLYS